jgi:hypothetical protein
VTPTEAPRKTRCHRHEYHALYWHLGPYGRQDVHLHPCFTEGCDFNMVGPGRSCGPKDKHVAKKLTIAKNAWSNRENEGKPL